MTFYITVFIQLFLSIIKWSDSNCTYNSQIIMCKYDQQLCMKIQYTHLSHLAWNWRKTVPISSSPIAGVSRWSKFHDNIE